MLSALKFLTWHIIPWFTFGVLVSRRGVMKHLFTAGQPCFGIIGFRRRMQAVRSWDFEPGDHQEAVSCAYCTIVRPLTRAQSLGVLLIDPRSMKQV